MSKFKEVLNEKSVIDLLCDVMGLDYKMRLGSGYYATTYKTKHNTVIKFTVDEKYMDYVALCQNSDNAFLPKILNNFGMVAKIGDDNTPVYAVELELYKEMSNADIYWTDEQEDEEPLSTIFENLKMCFQDSHDSGECISSRIMRRKAYSPVMELSKIYNLDLFEFLDALYLIYNRFCADDRCFFDLHLGNFMLASNGQMIITDPVGDRNNSDSGLYVSRGTSTNGDFLDHIQKDVADALRHYIGGDAEVSMFTMFKTKVMHKNIVGRKFMGSVEESANIGVYLGDTRLNEWMNYERAKTRLLKREKRGKREIVVDFNIPNININNLCLEVAL